MQFFAIAAIVGLTWFGSYNSLVSKKEAVTEAYANIDSQLKRRTDLIPNLVTTVKAYAKHETEVFDAVNKSRETMMSAKTISEKESADKDFTASINKLVAVAEAYPQLTSSTEYTGLMDELAGTENRINTARTDYNQNVKSYNTSLKLFPTSIIAKASGFTACEYFEVSESDKAPVKVDFSD